MTGLMRLAEAVGFCVAIGWVPLAAALNIALISQVKPGSFTWRIGAFPHFTPYERLTDLGRKILIALRWVTGVGLASWALMILLAGLW